MRCPTVHFGIRWWKIKLLWVRNLHRLFYHAFMQCCKEMLKCKHRRKMQIHLQCKVVWCWWKTGWKNKMSQGEGNFFLSSTLPSRYHTTSLSDGCLFLEAVCRNGGLGRDIGKQQQKCKIQDCVLQYTRCCCDLVPLKLPIKPSLIQKNKAATELRTSENLILTRDST